MPIVGSFAGASARAYGLGAGLFIGDFESIATVTLGSANSVTFTSIPQTYTHLQLRILLRSANPFATSLGYFNFNTGLFGAGTSANSHKISGDGSTAASANVINTSYMQFVETIGSTATANAFGAVILDVLDYTNTNKKKPFRSLYGYDTNGAGKVGLGSGFYNNTSAITQIDFTCDVNVAQFSSAALYGIKA
jgi:hypothetical protein